MKSVSELEEHRASLVGHCYRMLGSIIDADDAVQETMVRAWRGLDAFDGRSSLRTWLHRIATNVCLDALAQRARRERPFESGPECSAEDTLESRPHTAWLEPIPDSWVVPAQCDPAEAVALKQNVQLAFVAALQHLPPKQRAVLLLTEVLGWSAGDVSESLSTTLASVNSALQRARTTLAEKDLRRGTGALSAEQSAVVGRYVAAFESYDVDTLTTLLHEEAVLSMPPYTLWLRGHASIRAWMLGRGIGCRGSKLVPTWASGGPAFGQYRSHPDGTHKPWCLLTLELTGEQITGITSFLDTEALFPRFGLPSVL